MTRARATLRSCAPSAAGAEGEWLIKDGVKMRHGQGIYIDGMAEGQTYEGEWQDDTMTGRGVFRYASSAKYEGEFLKNLYHGHGIYTFPDGAAYDGPFSNNQMHGAGTFTDKQGVKWKGKFYNGSGPGLPGGAAVLAA